MMSSLFIGATGLKSHAEGMSVVTNNLSNVNTVGFKQAMMVYQDLMSSSQTADSNFITNMSQVGMGSRPGDVRRLFTEGGFETGSEPTDMAINGAGFFGVEKDGVLQFTRAGNFRFTKEGDLVDPNGWNLMGHAFTPDGVESPEVTPIKLNMGADGLGIMPGKATTAYTAISNLGGVTDTVTEEGNPFFSLASRWDGTAGIPLSSYSYAESIQLYDSTGTPRDAHIYYDLAGESNGQKAIEYVVAMDDPSVDGSGLAGTRAAGLLMAGTMTFSSDGQLQNQTGFTPPGSGNPQDLAGWLPATLVDGSPAFSATFAGAGPQTVALDRGLALNGSASAGLASAAAAAGDLGAVYGPANGATLRENSSTAYGMENSSQTQRNNGYAEGALRTLEVDTDGIMRGTYSNGQSQDLARVSLYRFTSQDGLRAEGGNRFSDTPASGVTEEGRPGEQNFGPLTGGYIEQSNVDFAREFTTMIITQRGFQMNSKIITTSDQMLQKALELKR